jgi:hypothetical protein
MNDLHIVIKNPDWTGLLERISKILGVKGWDEPNDPVQRIINA